MPEIEIAQPPRLSGPEINGVEARAAKEVLLAPGSQQRSESSLPFKTGPKDTRALGERKRVFYPVTLSCMYVTYLRQSTIIYYKKLFFSLAPVLLYNSANQS